MKCKDSSSRLIVGEALENYIPFRAFYGLLDGLIVVDDRTELHRLPCDRESGRWTYLDGARTSDFSRDHGRILPNSYPLLP